MNAISSPVAADSRAVAVAVAGVQGSMSATTEQLEEQLVENTEAVEECMAALQVGWQAGGGVGAAEGC